MIADSPRTAVVAELCSFTDVDEILAVGQRAGASDIHLGVNSAPIWRLNGVLRAIWPGAPNLGREETARMADRLLGESDRLALQERGHADFAYANELGRYRVSIVRQRLGIDLVFRVIKTQVRSIDELGLPPSMKLLTRYHNGLILVTG